MSYYQNLNPEQKKAVEFTNGPLLIVAGAGTGKTTVITERINWLITQQKLQPNEVLALTFTEKAAGEMEERVDKALPYGYVDLWISTFHSFAQRILEQHGLEIGLTTDFKLLDTTGSWLLVRNNLERFNLDYYKPLGNPTKFIHALVKHFSRCKDELITPADYLAYAEKFRLDNDLRKDEAAGSEAKRLEEIANAYHVYQQLLLENNLLDFGDLINYCLKLFQKRPQFLQKYRQQFKYILVDEFQDTNYAQYRLIKLLAEPNNNLSVVADDDQCLPPQSKIFTPSGQKSIKNIKKGEKVLTAVGKGHIGVSVVNRVFKNKKKAIILSIRTKRGFIIQVTDNHKMFSHAPSAAQKNNYCYVYLMWRQDIGWRLGITKNLAWRLSLERSADKIIGIKACRSEEEARYYEQLFSLKYSIPTYCFKDRNGLILKENRIRSLYQALGVNSGVKKLAKDLNVDLNSAHVYLDAVTRGKKNRVKINLNICYRNYRSKYFVKSNREIINHCTIQHQLCLQTSNNKIIKKLENAGFKMTHAKKGKCLRIISQDLVSLGRILKKIEFITNGITEVQAKIGKYNYQHLPALVMPAKNLLLGHFLPVKIGKEIIYDEIIEIKTQWKSITVYDLEIDKSHNFIANGVVVHNSIYKFRGASVSNILEFKKDFPKAKEILLNSNYRSCQNILDLAYKFIQLNNPDRLEVKLKVANKKLSKKLKSHLAEPGIIEHLHAETAEEEMAAVVNKIQELYQQEKEPSWSRFAILVRANDQANVFAQGLERAGIPYQFVASRGLFGKDVVLNLISFLRLLDDFHESDALYRYLSLPFFNLDVMELAQLTFLARRKAWSLWEAAERAPLEVRLNQETYARLNLAMNLIKKFASQTKETKTSRIIFDFLNESGYLKHIDSLEELAKRQQFSYLGQFYKRIKAFEELNDDKSVKNFLKQLGLELESGEQGSLAPLKEDESPDMVKLMTIHSAKGLEFKYVFVVNMVDRRFPTTERYEPIELPDELVKEIVPEGDAHLQEERRLFYVAITRAKEGIFFSSAEDYGGSRKKKISVFLSDLGFSQSTAKIGRKSEPTSVERLEKVKRVKPQSAVLYKDLLPAKFSFTQIKDFQNCPRLYFYQHILKVPLPGNHYFSFGSSIHLTLQKFYEEYKRRQAVNQGDLFKQDTRYKIQDTRLINKVIKFEELIKFYEASWIDDWYQNKKQKEEYFQKGKDILKSFYHSPHLLESAPSYLEKMFNLKVGEYTLTGKIDRIDETAGGYRIIDYKTGKPKEKLEAEDKEQLLIYQMAAAAIVTGKIKELAYYYLENDSQVSFLGKDKEIDKLQEKIIATIEEIRDFDFAGFIKHHERCDYCKNII